MKKVVRLPSASAGVAGLRFCRWSCLSYRLMRIERAHSQEALADSCSISCWISLQPSFLQPKPALAVRKCAGEPPHSGGGACGGLIPCSLSMGARVSFGSLPMPRWRRRADLVHLLVHAELNEISSTPPSGHWKG